MPSPTTGLSADQVFSFDDGPFQEAHAHDGLRPIRFRRVIDGRHRGRHRGHHRSGYRWIDLVIVPPGADIGIHTHDPDSEEVYIILSGTGQMTVDGARVEIAPGHVVRNRPAGTHSLVNTGEEEIRMVVVEVAVPPENTQSADPTLGNPDSAASS